MVKISKCEIRMHFIIKIHILYLTEKETDKTAFKLLKAFIDCKEFEVSLVITSLIYIICPFFSAYFTKSFIFKCWEKEASNVKNVGNWNHWVAYQRPCIYDTKSTGMSTQSAVLALVLGLHQVTDVS